VSGRGEPTFNSAESENKNHGGNANSERRKAGMVSLEFVWLPNQVGYYGYVLLGKSDDSASEMRTKASITTSIGRGLWYVQFFRVSLWFPGLFSG
jgi:hypothetical protein